MTTTIIGLTIEVLGIIHRHFLVMILTFLYLTLCFPFLSCDSEDGVDSSRLDFTADPKYIQVGAYLSSDTQSIGEIHDSTQNAELLSINGIPINFYAISSKHTSSRFFDLDGIIIPGKNTLYYTNSGVNERLYIQIVQYDSGNDDPQGKLLGSSILTCQGSPTSVSLLVDDYISREAFDKISVVPDLQPIGNVGDSDRQSIYRILKISQELLDNYYNGGYSTVEELHSLYETWHASNAGMQFIELDAYQDRMVDFHKYIDDKQASSTYAVHLLPSDEIRYIVGSHAITLVPITANETDPFLGVKPILHIKKMAGSSGATVLRQVFFSFYKSNDGWKILKIWEL